MPFRASINFLGAPWCNMCRKTLLKLYCWIHHETMLFQAHLRSGCVSCQWCRLNCCFCCWWSALKVRTIQSLQTAKGGNAFHLSWTCVFAVTSVAPLKSQFFANTLHRYVDRLKRTVWYVLSPRQELQMPMVIDKTISPSSCTRRNNVREIKTRILKVVKGGIF